MSYNKRYPKLCFQKIRNSDFFAFSKLYENLFKNDQTHQIIMSAACDQTSSIMATSHSWFQKSATVHSEWENLKNQCILIVGDNHTHLTI